MKIAVLCKPVLDCGVSLAIDEKEMVVTQKDQPPTWIVNPADRSAFESALLVKSAAASVNILAVSYAPAERTEALYYALARGADRGILIQDEKATSKDCSFIAFALARLLARERVDLVLCGNRSIDSGMGCVGPYVAEYLGIPQITQAVDLAVASNARSVTAQRRLEKGNREKVECKLPAVITVDPMLADPKYASIYAITVAQKKDAERIRLEDLDVDPARAARTRRVRLAPRRPRPKRTFIPDARLSPAERMKLIRSGGMVRKEDGQILSGSSENIAEGILAFLQEKGFLE